MKKENTYTILLFIIIFTIYLLFGFGVTISNDSVTNTEQIQRYDLMSRSSHFTFHLLGMGFYFILSTLFGLSAVTSTEIMLSLISTAGAAALFITVNKIFNNKRISVITAIVYAFSTGIFRFSIQAEYLVLVPSIALISLALFAYKKHLLSGIILAFGFLTTPFIILFLPSYFVFIDRVKPYRPNILKATWFATGFLAITIIIGIITYEETVSGHWSYGVVYEYYSDMILKLNYLRITANYIYGYLRSFNIMLIAAAAGLIFCYKINKKLFWATILVVIFHFPAAIPEARYGGYQLPVYPFISIMAALSIEKLFIQKKAAIIVVSVLIFLITNVYIVYTEKSFNYDLKQTYEELQNDNDIKDSTTVIVYQAIKPIKTIYAPRFKYVSILTEYLENKAEKIPGYKKPDLKEITKTNEEFYLIESGTSMPDDYIKNVFSGFIKNQGVKSKGFGIEKLKPFLEGRNVVKLEKYPIDVYKITN